MLELLAVLMYRIYRNSGMVPLLFQPTLGVVLLFFACAIISVSTAYARLYICFYPLSAVEL